MNSGMKISYFHFVSAQLSRLLLSSRVTAISKLKGEVTTMSTNEVIGVPKSALIHLSNLIAQQKWIEAREIVTASRKGEVINLEQNATLVQELRTQLETVTESNESLTTKIEAQSQANTRLAEENERLTEANGQLQTTNAQLRKDLAKVNLQLDAYKAREQELQNREQAVSQLAELDRSLQNREAALRENQELLESRAAQLIFDQEQLRRDQEQLGDQQTQLAADQEKLRQDRNLLMFEQDLFSADEDYSTSRVNDLINDHEIELASNTCLLREDEICLDQTRQRLCLLQASLSTTLTSLGLDPDIGPAELKLQLENLIQHLVQTAQQTPPPTSTSTQSPPNSPPPSQSPATTHGFFASFDQLDKKVIDSVKSLFSNAGRN